MRIVLAPDKFKSCLTAPQVCEAMAAGIRSVDPSIEIDSCPMADGGEGTVGALVAATGGRLLTRRVTGPLPDMRVDATFGILGDGTTAVIEMAAASGLALLRPEQRNPMNTTTYGTGELLMAAVEAGARKIILGIGGSATTDGGIGCAQACGRVPVLSGEGNQQPLERPFVGADLGRFLGITVDDRFPSGVEIVVACDVDNPLAGPRGAACTFGPQKGATPQQVRELDEALTRLGRKVPSVDSNTPGTGAAGGLGFGMMAFFHAKLQRGIDIVIDATRLRDRLRQADLCLTGEGMLDGQSLAGKTPVGVARLCRDLGIPCLAFAGTIGEDLDPAAAREQGLQAWFSLCDRPMSLEEAMHTPAPRLTRAVANVLRALHTNRPCG